jgi:hypothetical protein
MTEWFMRFNGKHHRIDEGLYLHFRDTCNVHEVTMVTSAAFPFVPRETTLNIQEIRLVPSRVGWVIVLYETKGVMTFFAQISATQAAWQRREWPPAFEKQWDVKLVQREAEHFLWVAECESKREYLSEPSAHP